MPSTQSGALSRQATLMKRRLALALVPNESQLTALQNALNLESVHIRGHRLVLVYSTLDFQWPDLLKELETHFQVRHSLWQRQRNRWYTFVDQNSAANALAQDAHCCNKIPKGYKPK